MIRIQVTAYNGAAPSQTLFAQFNELGGNIGRAEGNALVLHDPMRTISRTHASIAFRDDGYHIRNLGTAIPVYVNGQPLGNGREAAISAGDEIRINGYTMKVLAEETSASASGGYRDSPATSKDDPLKLFEAQSRRGPFDDLLAPSVGQNSPSPWGKGTAGAGEGFIIPSDFDPFGETPPSTPERRPGHPPSRPPPESGDVLDLGFGPSIPDQSIDKLFDLHSGNSSEPFIPGSPLAPSPDQPDGASVDPFVALGIASEKKRSRKQAQRDDVPELHGSFSPPEAKRDVAAMRPVLPGEPQTQDAPPDPYRMVLSWENKESEPDSGEFRSVIIPSPSHDRREAERRRSSSQSVASATAVTGEVVAPARTDASAKVTGGEQVVSRDVSSDSKSVAEREALLRAFLDSAGVPDLAIPSGLTPQFMDLLGHLLRESTQGTLDLLLARTLTKREVRAELTMIAPKENNPLKFSPNVDVALAHLLGPERRGFMTPLQAMKDAHDDLRAHQLGFMAGMRAALTGVLERFDPKELERRLTQKTVMDSLLPINRKAKLWDLFAECYKDISQEAEEDFHVLFGREFLRAYEAQIAKLEGDDKR